jgi:hypothetical protein
MITADNRLARCTLARVGCARTSGNWWFCACGAVGKANSPESAREALFSHKEKGRRDTWNIVQGGTP